MRFAFIPSAKSHSDARLINRCTGSSGAATSVERPLPSVIFSIVKDDKQTCMLKRAKLVCLKVVRNFGQRTSCPSEPVCYLSLETVFNMFHSVLLVAEIAGARLAQVEGIC